MRNNLKTESDCSKIRILFLGANPASTMRLKLDEEVRNIKHNLRMAKEGMVPKSEELD